jgi:hypothetical protein
MGAVLRFAVIAAAVAASLVYVQQHRVLQNAGLVGHCSEIATPAGKSGSWHECVSGSVTGTPGLSLSSCTKVSHSADRDVWRCPSSLGTNKIRQ